MLRFKKWEDISFLKDKKFSFKQKFSQTRRLDFKENKLVKRVLCVLILSLYF